MFTRLKYYGRVSKSATKIPKSSEALSGLINEIIYALVTFHLFGPHFRFSLARATDLEEYPGSKSTTLV